jgi:hypothetical protein
MLVKEVAESLKEVPCNTISSKAENPRAANCREHNDFKEERRIKTCHRSFRCAGCTIF